MELLAITSTPAALTTNNKNNSNEREEYCKSHGICPRCAKTKTNKRIVKLFGTNSKWEPLTIANNNNNNNGGDDDDDEQYAVYEGYCMDCYTMGEVQRLLGSSNRKRLLPRRPGRRKTRTNPETESVLDDTASVSSRHSILSGISGFSGFSNMVRRRKQKTNKQKPKRNLSSSTSSSLSSCQSLEDDITVDSCLDATRPRRSVSSIINNNNNKDKTLPPMIAHKIEQLVSYDYFTVLEVRNTTTECWTTDCTDALVEALAKTRTLHTVHLEGCRLGDEGVEKLASGLEGHVHGLAVLRLKGNKLGNRGVQALEFLFRSSSVLQELDLSDNAIGSKGANGLLESLAVNPSCALKHLDLSQNEIWDLPPTTRVLASLEEVNLDGNFLHDGGARVLADALVLAKQHKPVDLRALYLGWNGIGDDGVSALATAIESNTSLCVLGLAENDITNTGARALLGALAVNTTIREISGLYHNKIDRKFIIVAIQRLLHRTTERGVHQQQQQKLQEKIQAELVSAPNDDAEGHQTTPSVVGVDDSESSSSNRAYQDVFVFPTNFNNNNNNSGGSNNNNTGSIALEAIENWDWGTFGIDEIETQATAKKTLLQQQQQPRQQQLQATDDQIIAIDSQTTIIDKGATSYGAPHDRLVVFQSAPLAYFDRKTMQHHGVPLLDFESEAQCLRETFARHRNLDVVLETATQNNLNNFFAKSVSPILHFSCYGNADCIALENGFGYMQALALDSLKKVVARSSVKVVVVSSCYSNHLAEAFLAAGVPHVVALQRESTFVDKRSLGFVRGFYQALGERKSLAEAFGDGIQECTASSSSSDALVPYRLLPEDANHDVNVFFQSPPSSLVPASVASRDDMSILRSIPDRFVGREVDMYEILESLRVDDVIRIGGGPGCGKKSLLAVLGRYILDRSDSFRIDSIYWLPPPTQTPPNPDSLYGDLCQVVNRIICAEDDIWQDEDFMEARERILIEMETQNTILVIDGRIFANEIAGEMLEQFLTTLLNEVNVKIVLITAAAESSSPSSRNSRTKNHRSRSEETTIQLGPLDFAATARLFGSACPFIGTCSTIDTVDEFVRLLVPSSVANRAAGLDPNPRDAVSHRQKELYEVMGRGNPSEVLERAGAISKEEFVELLRIAQRPEIVVASSKELEEERVKWEARKAHALEHKYLLRASDIEKALREIDYLRSVYPSLDDLAAKEDELRKQFTTLLKTKRYDDANLVKRKILSLKRAMVKERALRNTSSTSQASAASKIQAIQERMKTMMALAESMGQSTSSIGGLSTASTPAEDGDGGSASFSISEECTLKISPGPLSLATRAQSAVVVWTNEACDASVWKKGMQGAVSVENRAQGLDAKLSALKNVSETKWGPVKCATGHSTAVVVPDGGNDALCNVVFAVPPLPTNHSEKVDSEYTESMLQSAIRSSFRRLFESERPPSTVAIDSDAPIFVEDRNGAEENDNGKYLAITLKTIVEESLRACRNDGGNRLEEVHLYAVSGMVESMKLIRLATMELGLSKSTL
jgi:hypothetical protein